MRRILLVLLFSMLACTLAGCPFFTREDASREDAPAPEAAEEVAPSEAPVVDEHAGHDHP